MGGHSGTTVTGFDISRVETLVVIAFFVSSH